MMGSATLNSSHQGRLKSSRRFVLGPDVTQRRLVRLERRHPQSINHPGVISWGHVVIRLAAQRLLRLIGEESVVGQEPPYRLTAFFDQPLKPWITSQRLEVGIDAKPPGGQ
jgi:hypothetical protein